MCAEWVLIVRWSRRSKPGRNNSETGRSSFGLNAVRPGITSFYETHWLRAQEDAARLRQVVRQTRLRLVSKLQAIAALVALITSALDGAAAQVPR